MFVHRASFVHSVWSLITLLRSFSSIMKFTMSPRNSRLISAPGGQISTPFPVLQLCSSTTLFTFTVWCPHFVLLFAFSLKEFFIRNGSPDSPKAHGVKIVSQFTLKFVCMEFDILTHWCFKSHFSTCFGYCLCMIRSRGEFCSEHWFDQVDF